MAITAPPLGFSRNSPPHVLPSLWPLRGRRAVIRCLLFVASVGRLPRKIERVIHHPIYPLVN